MMPFPSGVQQLIKKDTGSGQCFNIDGWVTGRASGLLKLLSHITKGSFVGTTAGGKPRKPAYAGLPQKWPLKQRWRKQRTM